MTNRRNNLIILGLVVVLIGVAAYLIFLRQPVAESTRLGLDLEGGVSANLQGYKTNGEDVTREEMDLAAGVIRQRVDSLGVTEPVIQIQGDDQVIVNIPGITDQQRAVEVIGRTAQLGFYQVLAADGGQVVRGDEVEVTKGEIRESLREDDAYKEGSTKIIFEETPNPQGDGTIVAGYVVREEPDLTGDALDSANLNRDQAGRLEVNMTLTREGARGFADLSGRIAESALSSGEPGTGQLAIVLDKDVVSAPVVEQSITGGQVVIQNEASPTGLPEEEARELEIVLQTGALPVNMEVLSVTSIGPTLGADSLRSGLLAMLAGFGLVLVFLAIIYRVLGIVAGLALFFFWFSLWGIIVAV